MDEKRKFKRLPSAERTLLGGVGQNESYLVDISPGGMKVKLDKELSAGTVITGQFSILPKVKPFFIQGSVVWSKKAEKSSSFIVGIRFTKVSTIPLTD